MGSKIVTRQALLGATLSEATAKLMYNGPCEFIGLAVDYAAAANGNTTITFYDGYEGDTVGDTIFAIATANTDIGTTVPVRVFGDARIIDGTPTAGVGLGLSFFKGIYVAVSADVTGPQNIRFWVRPLIKKIEHIVTTGVAGSAAGSAVLFQGPGRLKGAKVTYHAPPSTLDTQIYDGITTGGRALTVTTDNQTNWVSDNRQVATLTGIDEGGAAVTTAATGTYANDGVLFYTGITVGLAQGDEMTNAADVEILVEA